MIPIQFPTREGVTVSVLPANRFKAGMLSVSSVLPITKEGACLFPLLLSVLRRGTEHHPTLADLNRRLDYLWGTGFSMRNYYRGNLHVVGFSADLLDPVYLPSGSEDLLDAVLELMREILFHPVLDPDGLLSARYVESEKELQCDAIRATKNNPRAYASDRCRAILFEGEPCGYPTLGTEAETMAVTREQLTAFWKNWIANLQLDCFYVGAVAPDEVDRRIHAAFRSKEGNPKILGDCGALVRFPKGRGLLSTEPLPVSQSQLLLGLRCGIRLTDEDFYACSVYNEMLGSSPISRLFVYVREKKSLCYSCSSVYHGFTGTFLISCGIKRENRRRAEKEILHQLDVLRRGDFREEELEAAKKSLEHAYRQVEDSPLGLENYFFGRSLAGYRVPLEECRAKIAQVTKADIVRVANCLTLDVVYFLEGTLTGGGEDDDDGMDV